MDGITQLKCPYSACSTSISSQQIQQIVDESLFNKYQQFAVLQELRINPYCRWCPQPNCHTAILGDCTTPVMSCLKCPKCGYSICFSCNKSYHPNLTCKQFDAQSSTKEDQQFEKWLKKHGLVDPHGGTSNFPNGNQNNSNLPNGNSNNNSSIQGKRKKKRIIPKAQSCPRCKTTILKSGGCNEIKCGSCQFVFCWLCGAANPKKTFHYDSPNSCGLFEGCPERHLVNFLVGTILITFPIWALPAAGIYGTYKLYKKIKKR